MRSEAKTDVRSKRVLLDSIKMMMRTSDPRHALGRIDNFSWLMSVLETLGDPKGIETLLDLWDSLSTEDLPESMRRYGAFLQQNGHILRRHHTDWSARKTLLQIALEHGDNSMITLQAEEWVAEGNCDWHCVRRINRPKKVMTETWCATFEGHEDRINGVLELSNDRILSWSCDHTIRIWKRTGACLVVLSGHTEAVRGALEMADGTILSWSDDGTVKTWDHTGPLSSHSQRWSTKTTSIKEMPGERILTWNTPDTEYFLDRIDGTAQASPEDCALYLWGSDGLEATLRGHSMPINEVVVCPDGKIASCSDDGTIRLWSPDGGESTTLEGHTAAVGGVMPLNDGSILSWSADNTLRRWDACGELLTVFEGHSQTVQGAHQQSDQLILSWSSDKTIRVWNISGEQCGIWESEDTSLCGFIICRDDTILTWSDNIFRSGPKGSEGIRAIGEKTDHIRGIITLTDKSLVSWSYSNVMVLRDRDGNLASRIEGHDDSVEGVLHLQDNRFLSWSGDGTIKLWDNVGNQIGIIRVDTEYWIGPWHRALQLCDGVILFWSTNEGLLYVLNFDSGTLDLFPGNFGDVRSISELSDGSLLMWSGAKMSAVTRSGESVTHFSGHELSIDGAVELSNKSIVSWESDNVIYVWNRQGARLAALTGHRSSTQGLLRRGKDKQQLFWKIDGHLHITAEKSARTLPDDIAPFQGAVFKLSKDGVVNAYGTDGLPIGTIEGHREPLEVIHVNDQGAVTAWSNMGVYLKSSQGAPIGVLVGMNKAKIESIIEGPNHTIVGMTTDNRYFCWDQYGTFLCEQRGQPGRKSWTSKEGNVDATSDYLVRPEPNSVAFYWHGNQHRSLWNADSLCRIHEVREDGTVAVFSVSDPLGIAVLTCL